MARRCCSASTASRTSTAAFPVQLYAFDALMLEGNDLRKLPLSMRKANLARLLARRPGGHLRFRIRTGEIGVDLFRKTCEFDLAGLCQSAGTASTAPADRQVDQGQEPRHYGANATSYFAGLANIDPTASRTPVQSAPTSWALARAPRPRFNGSMRRLSLAIVLCLLAG
jgi:hypothetical protein